jgi:hypothetical protein
LKDSKIWYVDLECNGRSSCFTSELRRNNKKGNEMLRTRSAGSISNCYSGLRWPMNWIPGPPERLPLLRPSVRTRYEGHTRVLSEDRQWRRQQLKDRLGDQRGGKWMGADKNSSRRRSKLQQDEPAQSDTQNHTLYTSTFCLPKPHSHRSATGLRNKHYQQPRLLHEHDSGNNSGAGWQEGGGLTRYGGG